MCTVFKYIDANGVGYQARTHEDPEFYPEALSYYPAGTKIVSSTPEGRTGFTFDTKYPILSVVLQGLVPGAKQDSLLEGVNDQGLSFTCQLLKDTSSPVISSVDEKVLSANDLGSWVLGNFRSVAEVKKALESGEVDIWVPTTPRFNNVVSPVHWALFDKTGAGIVIEPTDNKIQVYDNTVGVMTNNPPFPWHLTNMRNYAHLGNVDKNIAQFNGLKVVAFDPGLAAETVPSGHTSPARFVKAAYYSAFAKKANTPRDAVLTLAHMINNFDRVSNITLDLPDSSAVGSTKAPSTEITLFSSFNDLVQNHFYIRTVNAMNFTKFDMRKLAVLKSIKSVTLASIDEVDGGDGTYLLLN
jgi:choloylglycine hydrolase